MYFMSILGGKFHNITAGVCGRICCSESDVRCLPSSSCSGLLEGSCTSQTKGTKFVNHISVPTWKKLDCCNYGGLWNRLLFSNCTFRVPDKFSRHGVHKEFLQVNFHCSHQIILNFLLFVRSCSRLCRVSDLRPIHLSGTLTLFCTG